MLRWSPFPPIIAAAVLGLAGFCEGAAPPPAVAAAPHYVTRAWQQADDGLPQNTVTAIAQTRDGYLWLGTFGGLVRFDGARFTVFDNTTTPSMRSRRVTSLYEAEDGALWIGHESGEITRFKDGAFQSVGFGAAWSETRIQDISADEAGNLWLLNADGLLARLSDARVLVPPAGALPELVSLARSENGTLWVLRHGQVSVLDHGALRPLHFAEGSDDTHVQGIGASRDGALWVASERRLRKWKDGKWVEDLGPAPWGAGVVTRLVELRGGGVGAATTRQGLYLVLATNEVVHLTRASGLPSDSLLSLREDREGELWAGTANNGLMVARAGNVELVNPPDQWQGRAVSSVSLGGGGALWAGTEGAGVYRLRNGTWTNFAGEAGLANLDVWSVLEDAEGRVWAGTWGAGLLVGRGGRFEPAPGLQNVVPPMTALLSSTRGGLWIGTGAGLLRYDGDRTNSFPAGVNGAAQDVRAVIEDRAGTVWYGTFGGGLGRLDGGSPRVFRRQDGLSSDFVQCLYLDQDNVLWIGTAGGGLNRFKQDKFTAITANQGLANDVICHIEQDDRGFFWLSSHGGIMRVSKSDLDRCADGEISEVHPLIFGVSDGLPTLECSGGLQPAGCKTADGRLWFPTSKGLVTLDPRKVKTNPLPPKVAIEAVLVDGEPVPAPAARGEALRIPPGRHHLEFQYTGLSFMAPERVRFKHELVGFESAPVAAGARRVADYNYVPPGSYVFRVTACNNDGVWQDEWQELPFKVSPYIWQTIWFRVLAAGLVIAGSAAGAWFESRQRMRRKLELIERQRAVEQERSRIARDIHDDLGSHLTRITMLSESTQAGPDHAPQTASGLRQIYDTARELTRAMDEIVWAVNPQHDSLDSLVSYLEKFALDFLGSAGIRCRLDMPLSFPGWPLTTELRHSLFLAFKEALNNIVKHAAASEVRVALTLQGDAFTLALEDNGRGFEPAATPSPSDAPGRPGRGNGLANMRRRLHDLGGHCEIQSLPGQGARVAFTVPVPAA